MVYEKLTQYGPLPLRILTGIAFIIHGLPKLSNITGTEHFFANMIGLPAALALPIGLLEVIGGIALTVGVSTLFWLTQKEPTKDPSFSNFVGAYWIVHLNTYYMERAFEKSLADFL